VLLPLQFVAKNFQFPLTDVLGEFGNEDAGLPASNWTAIEQLQRQQLLRRLDPGMEPPSACRIKALAPQFQFHRWSHTIDERHEALRQKVEWWRHRIVRSAFERQGAVAGGRQQTWSPPRCEARFTRSQLFSKTPNQTSPQTHY
jgi:hypothetical protein